MVMRKYPFRALRAKVTHTRDHSEIFPPKQVPGDNQDWQIIPGVFILGVL